MRKNMVMATVTFLGAAGTTTGSRHLVEINGKKILLDCGLFQGRRGESYERNRHFGVHPVELDAVILSHAHIDHSGALPSLCKQGFEGNVYVTPATRDLCQLMLIDSAKVQAADIEFLNKRRARQGLPPAEVLYTPQEAEQSVRQMVAVAFRRPILVTDGVRATFFTAGHILGAAQIALDWVENGKSKRLLFSGDIGRPDDPLLPPPEPVNDVEVLIMESTYGGRDHPSGENASHELCRIINEAVERGGRIIIPAFAVERTQQILYRLHENIESGCIPPIPIYVDSPLATDATGVFRLHPDSFRPQVYEKLFERENPFGFDQLYFTRQKSQSVELNTKRGPLIIISASGMCEGGRVLHHLRNHIGDPTTTILFVGFQAEHTLGARLVAGAQKVNILGEEFVVRAKIEQLGFFSGHADRGELLDYFEKIGGPKSRVFLVHGEREQAEALQKSLLERFPRKAIHVASLGERYQL